MQPAQCLAPDEDVGLDLYQPVKKDESALKMRIKVITDTRVHYGYRRVHVMLRREGHMDNVKRACIACIARKACHCG